MIVVVGAGYAGVMAANSVARGVSEPVVLVNERDTFVERVRLHQLAAGQSLRVRPLAGLLRGPELAVGRVVRIDADERVVHLGDGRTIGYDTLVYALGSSGDLSVPGAAEFAFDVGAYSDAVRLRDRLAGGGSAVVVGGGLTGIEAAAELARPDLKVSLVTDRVGAGLSERGRSYVLKVLERRGVSVREGVRVESVHGDGVVLVGGESVAADAVVWTAGFRVPGVAREAGFAVDGSGRMVVDGTLRSVSHEEVYGVGDAAAVRVGGQELRMACATGLPAGQHVGKVIAALRSGRAVPGLRFRYVNQCVSLGRGDALVQFVLADDSARDRVLTGRVAAWYKEAIVRGTVFVQRHPRVPVSL
ncbi:NAD(P)/FAD-dependent oxidoreductase [Actinokineospora guangxiensis]|uniref:NAD(P)/FAD-dependent oxidoreductase n=1 Tax=Actinokineospora guangxiensis TaxID=1490288 RepID=A0ABW0EQY9_9PSEU